MTFTIDKEIDVCGFNCPMPILKTKKALADLVSGQVLRVSATDPGSLRDFQAFAKQTGHTLLAQSETDGVFVHVLRHK